MWFHKKRQIAICIAAIMIIGGFLAFRYWPIHKRMKAIDRERVNARIATNKALALSRKLPGFENEKLEVQEAVSNYAQQVPGNRDLGNFLHRIAELMNAHELSGQKIEPGKEIRTEKVNGIPVDMHCKGRLEQIFGFYKSLQNLDRLVRIDRVELKNGSGFSGNISMQTQAVIYYELKNKQG